MDILINRLTQNIFSDFLKIFIFLSFLYSFQTLHAQKPEDALKTQAQQHMTAGRYGEAIDLLNKYISAYPQQADGYNLRGLAFEARSQFQNSVLDFRRARKWAKPNEIAEVEKNLNRVIKVWHAQLRKKIEGHEREIAIDPSNPVNYLEIGKSYRWLEEWPTAELWYDKYLELDPNASPDEMIRYTEILSHTGSIEKGERWLKIYVERYPEDWRLWSRYGYFTMWLGNYRNAEDAFEKALSFKPFFKEAQDGLDMARNQAYVTQQSPRSFEKEFPIDRYYRVLRSRPDDIETRFKLVDELIAAERMEEALQQLQIIGVENYDDPRYDEKLDFVTTFRDEVYRERIALYESRLQENPTDRDAVKNLADYYARLEEYDSAFYVLDTYFSQVPDESDPALRFQYARVAAWSRDFDRSITIMDGLLTDYPNNLDYQLFRGQLSVWHNVDIELGREYLENVIEARPENIEALIALGSLMLIDRDYDQAQVYADRAKEINPNYNQIAVLQSRIDFERLRAEEERLYEILNQGRELVMDDDCVGALPYYEDYLSQAEPNNLILKEYGDVQFCAGYYEQALSTYDEVLSYGYMYEASLNRAKVLYALGDSLAAVEAFRGLVEEEPLEFEPRLYLGDSYAKAEFYDSARAVYDTLLTWDLDSTEISMVEQRLDWLPITGLNAILATFPNYVGLAPDLSFYSDNLSFRFSKYGARLELGLVQWLALGMSFYKTHLNAKASSLNDSILTIQMENGDFFTGSRTFTTFKGHVFLTLTDHFRAGTAFGTINSTGETLNESELYITYEQKDHFRLNGYYLNTDAAVVLYSPYLIDTRLSASLLSFDGYYQHKSGLRLSTNFQYISVSDDNAGNNLELRLGRYFYEYLRAGYEYFYRNWRYDSPYYYSPANYESHSLWFDADLEKSEEFDFYLGGQFGYIPADDFILLQGRANAVYRPMDNLILSGQISVGSTSRDRSSYKFVSGQISAYWTLF